MKMPILERKFFGKYIKNVRRNTLMINELDLTNCPRSGFAAAVFV